MHGGRSRIALAAPALAQTANIEGVLQNIVTMLTGNVARLLATLAVIIVGIAWMFGYLDLRKAAYVVLGVAITFGASEVVSTLTGVANDRRHPRAHASHRGHFIPRPARVPPWLPGSPMEAMALNVMFSCILFLAAGSILYGLVALPIHGLCRIVCRHDPQHVPDPARLDRDPGTRTQRAVLGWIVLRAAETGPAVPNEGSRLCVTQRSRLGRSNPTSICRSAGSDRYGD